MAKTAGVTSTRTLARKLSPEITARASLPVLMVCLEQTENPRMVQPALWISRERELFLDTSNPSTLKPALLPIGLAVKTAWDISRPAYQSHFRRMVCSTWATAL